MMKSVGKFVCAVWPILVFSISAMLYLFDVIGVRDFVILVNAASLSWLFGIFRGFLIGISD